jgi:hypothetical protein
MAISCELSDSMLGKISGYRSKMSISTFHRPWSRKNKFDYLEGLPLPKGVLGIRIFGVTILAYSYEMTRNKK